MLVSSSIQNYSGTHADHSKMRSLLLLAQLDTEAAEPGRLRAILRWHHFAFTRPATRVPSLMYRLAHPAPLHALTPHNRLSSLCLNSSGFIHDAPQLYHRNTQSAVIYHKQSFQTGPS